VGLKKVAVNAQLRLLQSTPLTQSAEEQLAEGEKTLNQLVGQALKQAGLTVYELKDCHLADARLDVCVEMRQLPDSPKVACTIYLDCIQLVRLARAANQQFAAVTWRRIWHTPYLEIGTEEAGSIWVNGVRSNVLNEFIGDWRTANDVASSLGPGRSQPAAPPWAGGARPPQPNAAAQQEYQKMLNAYQEALSQLNNMRSLVDARRGLESVSPPSTSKFGTLMSGLSPAVDNFNVRAAEQNVEIARQQLERARARIDHAEMNPLQIIQR
jgi:hypothetical protein